MTDTIWTPDLSQFPGPKYLGLSRALRDAIRQGQLAQGAKLPTVRDLAWAVGVTPGTVSRAYQLATQEGLLAATVGRGTFVASAAPRLGPKQAIYAERDPVFGAASVDLRSPQLPDVGQTTIFADTLRRVSDGVNASWLDYSPQHAEAPLRAAVCDWLAERDLGGFSADDIALTYGGQNAVTLVLQCCLRGDRPVVLTEDLCYPGFARAARLMRADVVYCEDTRHSAKLLQHFAIHAVTRPFHEHNEETERTRVLAELEAGKAIALISDAGTPLVSDPGFKLVRACAAAGHFVSCIPGPSSLVTALAASGLPTDAFFFGGFLPPKQAARRARLAEIKAIPATLIFFEAPQRAAATLADMADVLGERLGVVARELTKMHEEMARAPLSALARDMAERDLKGEIVLLVGPPLPLEISDADITAQLEAALETMRLKDAANAVADALGVSKSRVYGLGLKVKQDTQ